MTGLSAPELAGRLGLRRHARDWRGRCPACSYPGAFSVREGDHARVLAWCCSCQDKAAIGAALDNVTDGAWTPPEQREPQSVGDARARKQEAARRCWSGSSAIAGTLGETYLWSRFLGFLTASPVLRYRADTSHPQGGRLPAMVALVTDAADQPLAVHRTYLDRATGRKADIEPAKASLGPVWGGAIRLARWKPDLPLVVGEGIETAASAGLMMDAPAWAAISAGNLAAGLVLPAEVRHVVIAADPDDPGEQAAQQAARRWMREGRRVEIARATGPGDFNDQMQRDAGHG